MRPKVSLFVPIALCAWLAPLDLHAAGSPQARPSPSPSASSTPSSAEKKLKTVVVTATRIEQPAAEVGDTVTVIDSDQLDTQKIQQVSTALQQVPGLVVTQSGSPGTVTDVSIRGSTPSQTLILLDGVEVNSGLTGSFDMSNLTTDNLDRMEILRGAGGSLYGSQAIGGVINVLSQEGEGTPQLNFLSEGGNRATQRQVATFSGAEGSLGFSGGLSYFSTQGFRQINDSSDNLSGAFRLDWHVDDSTTVSSFARYIRANVSLAGFAVASGFPLDPNAHQRQEFMLYKGQIEHHFGERLLVRVSPSFVRNDLRVNATPFPGDPVREIDRIPDEIRGGIIEAIYTWSPKFQTLAGFDFKDRWARSLDEFTFGGPPTAITVFHERRQEYAGYLEQTAKLFGDHLLVTGGFRVDGNSNFGKEVSPSWSVLVPIKQLSTTLRGNYSEGFRAPSFDELFFPFFGNPNLRPEISSEYDGGFTTEFGERASLTATYFSRRVHSLIVTVPVPVTLANPFGSMAGNAGRVDVQGVEVEPKATLLPGLTLGGNVTVLDETHANAAGATAQPLRVPKHAASSRLQYVRESLLRPRDRATLTLAYLFVGDRDDITTTSTIANHTAYHRFDLTGSYALGAAFGAVHNEEAFFRISNLLDRRYSEAFGFPAPPVNFVAGIKVELE